MTLGVELLAKRGHETLGLEKAELNTSMLSHSQRSRAVPHPGQPGLGGALLAAQEHRSWLTVVPCLGGSRVGL